jgi:hypothetical protein
VAQDKGKRRPAGAFDRSRPIPLRQVANFGPKTAAEFEAMGITTLQALERLGAERVARRWVAEYPERLCATAFLGIVTALDGLPWTRAADEHRERAKALVDAIRKEWGLPPTRAR